MATLAAKPVLDVTTTFTVSEGELRALDALAGYGDDAFIKMFYKELGTTYMKPHEADLRHFLKSVRALAGPILSNVNAARKVMNGVK